MQVLKKEKMKLDVKQLLFIIMYRWNDICMHIIVVNFLIRDIIFLTDTELCQIKTMYIKNENSKIYVDAK